MMNYDDFAMNYMKQLQAALESQRIELHREPKNKVNVTMDGLMFRYPASNIGPIMYLEDKYELYQNGYSVQEIVKQTLEQLENIQSHVPNMPELTEESARKNLYCALISAEENKKLLENVPYQRFNDLAVVARFRVDDDASFLVTDNLYSTFQMTAEEILEQAYKNTEQQGFTCHNMEEILKEMLISEGMPEEHVNKIIETQATNCPMYVLTNQRKTDGAVAIIFKDVLEKVHQKIGEDFYILPSSRHEVILMPKSTVNDVQELKQLVEEVNGTEIKKTDKLSDHVYQYDSVAKKVSIADVPEQVKKEVIESQITKSHTRSH